MNVNEKINLLRNMMKNHGLSAYVIPSSDAHLSEYVATHWQGRAYMSGFTGSAGTLVITLDESGLFTDGRYFIQAENELKGSEVKLFKMAQPGVPTINEYLVSVLNEGDTVGFDGKVLSVATVKEMKKAFEAKHLKLKVDEDLLDSVWENRPAIPSTDVFVHETQYTGYSCHEKLSIVREEMKKISANGYVLTALGSIAWLFNVRGDDILFNPLVVSYGLVLENEAYLFVDNHRLSEDVKTYLTENGVTLKDYAQIDEVLNQLSGSILCPVDSMNYYLYDI
ncbi:aminopeptidase P family protein, partial [Turicibacter sanguinis]|nr:aminopeptidase P family protein [Turicibacter sanguinis]